MITTMATKRATAIMDTAPEPGCFRVMKTNGLIGGMSWEFTVSYYRLINTAVKEKLGGLHSAKCVLYSVDFAEIEVLQQEARWGEATQVLAAAGQSVERAGAYLALLCTNTMHKVAEALQGSRVPLFDTTRIHALVAVKYAF